VADPLIEESQVREHLDAIQSFCAALIQRLTQSERLKNLLVLHASRFRRKNGQQESAPVQRKKKKKMLGSEIASAAE
jgi:hypothetical protein